MTVQHDSSNIGKKQMFELAYGDLNDLNCVPNSQKYSVANLVGT